MSPDLSNTTGTLDTSVTYRTYTIYSYGSSDSTSSTATSGDNYAVWRNEWCAREEHPYRDGNGCRYDPSFPVPKTPLVPRVILPRRSVDRRAKTVQGRHIRIPCWSARRWKSLT